MSDVSDLRWAIVPKSDQLNSEQLLAGPMTITVSGVAIGSDDQPLVIHYQGDDGRPYKPCKTMRKALIYAWGHDGRQWAGKSMTLFNDPKVRFGGQDVGGIRISHMSDIARPLALSLTATKGKKALHTITPLKISEAAPGPTLAQVLAMIADAQTPIDMQAAKAAAGALTGEAKTEAAAAFRARLEALKTATKQATEKQFGDLIIAIDEAPDADAARKVLDEARETLPADKLAEIEQAFAMAWEQQK